MINPSVKFSLRWKLLIVMVCLVVSVLSISTFLQIVSLEKIFNRELESNVALIKEKLTSKGKVLADHLSNQVQNDLATVNLSKISEVLHKSVLENKELSYALLIDQSNRVYIHTLVPELELEIIQYSSNNVINYNTLDVSEHSLYGLPVIEFVAPIQISTEPWGSLRLGFSLEILNKETAVYREANIIKIQDMIQQSLWTALLFIFITSSIIIILLNRLSKPLREISRVANQLASGDFSAAESIEINSNDEVGVLSAAFINMSNELKLSYDVLQNHNQTLEAKVKERTIELALARDEAIKANQTKSNFLSMVSHEVRTPMNAITGLTQILLKTDLKDKQYDNLKKIKLSANTLLVIIDDILDSSKIEAGQMSIEQVPFKLDEILSHLKSLLDLEANSKQLDLSFEIMGDIPETIIGDPTRLSQVLLNLINNAIKFTEEGHVIVSIKPILVQPSSTNMLEFSIKDTGIGLTENQMLDLFKPFVQADVSTSRIYGGTGLGLYISKQLISLMGGEIKVNSTKDVGSEFVFTISLQQAVAQENSTLVPAGEINKTILVVDDYFINQEVAKALLEDEGFSVILADSGDQAIKVIKDKKPDAILMDLQMPMMDGFEATRLIYSDGNNLDIPIIGLTAHTENRKKDQCLSAGMIDCISKPIDINILLETLKTAIFKVPSDHSYERFSVDELGTGLNIEEGIKKVAGNKKLYFQLLLQFKDQFSSSIQMIRKHMNNAEKNLAIQLIHGIKGVAGNIAAFSLESQIKKLELVLLKQQEYKIELDLCEKEMQAVLGDIDKLIIKNNEMSTVLTDSPKIDLNLAAIALSQLIELIKLYCIDVDLYFEELKNQLDHSDYTEALTLLEGHLNEYDFISALAICDLIKQNIPKECDKTLLQTNLELSTKPRVLIVEDLAINIKVLANPLRDYFHIQIAQNGIQAMTIAKIHPQPDIILLDIDMPEMNGYELCQKLKIEEQTKLLPIIFITGLSETIDETKGFELGCVDYITKPFESSIVLARINSHIKTKQKNDLLAQLASIDSLTAIPNRRMFDETFYRLWQEAISSKKPLSMIFIDVDFFKNFNDFYGHAVGDQCLCIIAKVLKQTLKRKNDFIARFGGEEFVAILPETNEHSALLTAELMRMNIEKLKLPHMPNDKFTSVTISLGLASIIPVKNSARNTLINAADNALYEAKFKGRNQVITNSMI